MPSTTDKPVLAIGDVHGHLDRLEALLKQEGIIGVCPDCQGGGDESPSNPIETVGMCPRCDGDGITRLRDDCVVVQLGDLGHFGSNAVGNTITPASSTGDFLCYHYGKKWLDYVLWGNHDRAVIDKDTHAFTGYIDPPVETFRMMQSLRDEGRLLLTFAAHEFVLTHAGVHRQFKYNDTPPETKTNAKDFAEWVNTNCGVGRDPIVDAVSRQRGGHSPYGGILWRDANESLFSGFRQVFGHTSKPKVRKYGNPNTGWSYCIDIGDADNGRLAGIWLPDEKVVEIHLDKNPLTR